MSETTAHEALASFLKHYAIPRLPDLAFAWHTANESAGGAKSKDGIPLDVLKESRMGVRPGVWDWMYVGQNLAGIGECSPFHFLGLAIELKSTQAYRSKDQGLSVDQKLWRAHYIKHGWYTAIYPEQAWPDAARLLIKWVGGDVNDFNFG